MRNQLWQAQCQKPMAVAMGEWGLLAKQLFPRARRSCSIILTYCSGNSWVNNDRNPGKERKVDGKEEKGDMMHFIRWPGEPTFLLETSPCNFLLLNMTLTSHREQMSLSVIWGLPIVVTLILGKLFNATAFQMKIARRKRWLQTSAFPINYEQTKSTV